MESKAFLVTARKFRPQLFRDVVGQSHITKTLKNAIQQNRIHHAYLFNGPRGVGKTTTARIFARAVNCFNLRDGEPCNECEICRNSLEGRSLDIIEIDGASNNSVDDIRKLRENVKFPPVQGRYKMYIIDEVHMLSTSAFNALLKTLEEPPEHLLFVFATTEPHKVPPTILSRCQRFDFRRMEMNDITQQLSFISEKESILIDEQSLFSIAKKADGSMRDAESIFDQVVAFTGKEITYQKLSDALHLIDEDFFFDITEGIVESDLKRMFELASKVVKRGYDYIETLQGLLEHCRNLLAVKITSDTTFLETSMLQKAKYLEHSKEFDQADLIRIIQFLSSSEQQIKYSPQQKVRFELTLAQLAYLPKTQNISELINLIKTGAAFATTEIAESPAKTKSNVTATDQFKEKSVASEQVLQSKSISIDLADDGPAMKKEKSEAQVTKSVPKSILNDRWNEFLDKFANAQYQLTTLSHIQVDFEDNSVLFSINSDIIYENFTSKATKEKLQELINEFYDTKINLNFILDRSAHSRDILGVSEPNATYDEPAIKPTEKFEEKNETMKVPISKQEDITDVEKTIMELFNAKELNKG